MASVADYKLAWQRANMLKLSVKGEKEHTALSRAIKGLPLDAEEKTYLRRMKLEALFE